MCLSGPRPVASQMGVCEEDYYCKPALPTHTVSKTYIHKTHFPRHPTPHPQSTVEQRIGKPSISFRIWETQRLVTVAQWRRQEWNAAHVCTFPTFTKVWMFLISIQIENNKHTSTLINMAAVICGWPVPACPKLHIFISFSLTLPLFHCARLCIYKAYKIQRENF